MRAATQRIEMRCILFCDLVRSTPQSVRARQTGEEAAFNDRLVRFAALWSAALVANGAAFIKPLGDGLLATFTDPLSALKAVTQAWESLRSDSLCAGLPMRVGLHVGTVSVLPDGDILGADAALGERVMKEARAEQVLISEACAAPVRPYLPPGYKLHDLGERPLQGFDTPIRLYQLRAPGLPDIPPSAVPVSRPITGGPVRLLLVDDEAILRAALAGLLRLEPDFDLLGQAANGVAAVAEAEAKRPDVVLMDIEMPQMDGIEATRRIKETCPDTEIIILTKFGDDEKVFRALKAGAIGYMLKDAGVEEIGPAIRAVYRKEGFLSPALVARVMKEFTRLAQAGQETRALFAELTRREIEVLELLGTGMRNRPIAEKLFLSEKTVKNHISNILAKLQVNDRTEAALLARQHGLAQ
jgi:DNA-binding NarL/FixJ family response regulator/class 3 adenylate cyclase